MVGSACEQGVLESRGEGIELRHGCHAVRRDVHAGVKWLVVKPSSRASPGSTNCRALQLAFRVHDAESVLPLYDGLPDCPRLDPPDLQSDAAPGG